MPLRILASQQRRHRHGTASKTAVIAPLHVIPESPNNSFRLTALDHLACQNTDVIELAVKLDEAAAQMVLELVADRVDEAGLILPGRYVH